jgi:hypothetical protein
MRRQGVQGVQGVQDICLSTPNPTKREKTGIGYCPELPELLELPVYQEQAELAKLE